MQDPGGAEIKKTQAELAGTVMCHLVADLT